ncbi:MAG: hypothetical protein E6552_06110, partial [Sutterella wadsworthensis]|nr:hypothetical protein [Sutterella wadsworthensis]
EAKVNLLTRKDWSWDVTANTSFVKNMVKKLPTDIQEHHARSLSGERRDSFLCRSRERRFTLHLSNRR